MGWPVPVYGHVPLIHGPDGAKLSKRHGALAVEAYRDMGYLPEAMRNYLLRLGWSHGDDEIIPTAQAIEWFNLNNIGRSAARFDFKKLDNINGHYIRQSDDAVLAREVAELLARIDPAHELDEKAMRRAHRRDAGIEGARQDAGGTRRRRRVPLHRWPARAGCTGREDPVAGGPRHAGPHGGANSKSPIGPARRWRKRPAPSQMHTISSSARSPSRCAPH